MSRQLCCLFFSLGAEKAKHKPPVKLGVGKEIFRKRNILLVIR